MRLAIAALAVGAWAADQGGSSVKDVLQLVETGLAARKSDDRIAKALRQVKISQNLDDRWIEQLESEGAGSRTLAELRRLQRLSFSLPKPSPAAVLDAGLVPSAEEQARTLDAAREKALHYNRSLPDFICTESVQRYNDSKGKLVDTLTMKLSYFGQKENYQLLTVNGRPTFLSYDAVGGVITQGEFGSLLDEVFELRSAAEFHWDHWTTLRGRPTGVYTFSVSAARSHYRMEAHTPNGATTAVVGQHGLIYVDRDSSNTVRVYAAADTIPHDFPVQSASTILDYDFSDIGGKPFLLPLRAVTRMDTYEAVTRNEVAFTAYRKFASDSNITFDPH